MKLLIILSSVFFISASSKSCKEHLPAGCYKARLEIKENCMNYTLTMQSKDFDASMVVPSWTDENTGKTYKNAFALGSRCTFPDSLNVGDEFYFTIDSTTVQNCAVCMMYYPTPQKKLSIKVLKQPCTSN
jgi:hypothetical protein